MEKCETSSSSPSRKQLEAEEKEENKQILTAWRSGILVHRKASPCASHERFSETLNVMFSGFVFCSCSSSGFCFAL